MSNARPANDDCSHVRQGSCHECRAASEKKLGDITAAIRTFTIDAPNGEPNGEAERQLERLQEALNPRRWRGGPERIKVCLEEANAAAEAFCKAAAADTKRLRIAAEAFFGGDFRKL